MSESIERPETIWVCQACGKTSTDRMGDEGSGWDSSCYSWSVLCWKSSVVRDQDGRVVKAEAVKP